MPAPIAQNKYSEQMVNNAELRDKMRLAFSQVYESLSNTPLGSLEDFDVTIDSVNIRFRNGDDIRLNGQIYNDCTPTLRKQGYDRLEKFMQIALARYNNQFNL